MAAVAWLVSAIVPAVLLVAPARAEPAPDDSIAPLPSEPPGPALDGWCSKGLRSGWTCCDSSCKVCGGPRCSGACCGEHLRRKNRRCQNPNDVSCMIPEDGKETTMQAGELVVVGTGAWRHSAYPEDIPFATAIARFLAGEGARRVIDVGSGDGTLARTVASQANISVLGVDGNTNTAAVCPARSYPGAGRVRFRYADLAVPFPKELEGFDWATHIAVAEHVPFHFEHILLSNLLRASVRGLVLMWGARFMPGIGHVNCRDESEVLSIFGELGYTVDWDATREIRKVAILYWNRYTLVLRRPPRPADGHIVMPSLRRLADMALRTSQRACWPPDWESQREDCCLGGLTSEALPQAKFTEGYKDALSESDRISCFGAGFDMVACCATEESYHYY